MTPDDLPFGRVDRVLAALPRQEPRAGPAARLRSKCHERLAKRVHPRRVRTQLLTSRGRLLAGTALAGAVAVLYLAAVVGRAFALYGF